MTVRKQNILLWLRILAFILCCVSCYVFLSVFTETGEGFNHISWDSARLITADGEQDVPIPTNRFEDGTYVLTGTLEDVPQPVNFGFTQEANELELAIDGDTVYTYKAPGADSPAFSVTLILPEDCEGKTVTMRYRPLNTEYAYLPILTLTGLGQTDAEIYGYANRTAIPAGFFALAFLLLAAMLLLNRRFDWRLIPLMTAFLVLGIRDLSVAQGFYFLPEGLVRFLAGRLFVFLPLALMTAHIILNRRRTAKKVLAQVTFVSLGAILAAYLFSLASDGRMALNINGLVRQLFTDGYYDGILAMITEWAVFVCLASAVYNMTRDIAASETEKRVLALREEITREAYIALEENARKSGELRHELKNHVTAMTALAHRGEYDKLTDYLDVLDEKAGKLHDMSYTDNFLVNTILQRYAAKCADAGIEFEPVVSVPPEVSVSDEDLAVYLMNMLDNALEATADMPKEAKPFIRVKLQMNNGFLTISCTNPRAADLNAEDGTALATTKEDTLSHGFGLKQMRRVAEKYNSVLVIDRGGGMFTVKTALKPSEPIE